MLLAMIDISSCVRAGSPDLISSLISRARKKKKILHLELLCNFHYTFPVTHCLPFAFCPVYELHLLFCCFHTFCTQIHFLPLLLPIVKDAVLTLVFQIQTTLFLFLSCFTSSGPSACKSPIFTYWPSLGTSPLPWPTPAPALGWAGTAHRPGLHCANNSIST